MFSRSSDISATMRDSGPKTTCPCTAGPAGELRDPRRRRASRRPDRSPTSIDADAGRADRDLLRLEPLAVHHRRPPARGARLEARRSARGRSASVVSVSASCRRRELDGLRRRVVGQAAADDAHRDGPGRQVRRRQRHARDLFRIRHLTCARQRGTRVRSSTSARHGERAHRRHCPNALFTPSRSAVLAELRVVVVRRRRRTCTTSCRRLARSRACVGVGLASPAARSRSCISVKRSRAQPPAEVLEVGFADLAHRVIELEFLDRSQRRAPSRARALRTDARRRQRRLRRSGAEERRDSAR